MSDILIKKPRYDRLMIVPLEGVIKKIKNNLGKPLKGSRSLLLNTPVHLTSIRLRTFATKGTDCCVCGTKGRYFAIERNFPNAKEKNELYHINLWGIRDGKEILMTQDHIIPRSAGGKDILENSCTMCTTCNNKKGSNSLEDFKVGKTMYNLQSLLIGGKVRARQGCPFQRKCAIKINGNCNHKGVNHELEFSCAVARGFDLIRVNPSSQENILGTKNEYQIPLDANSSSCSN